MKIAIVGAIDSPISENSYGGTEIWAYNLAEELVKKGYQVSLFAGEGSKFSGDSIIVSKKTDIFDKKIEQISKVRFALYSINEMVEVVKREADFDIIHISAFNYQYSLPFVKFFKKPVIITLHSPYLEKDDSEIIFKKFSEPTYIFISKNYADRLYKPEKYEIIYHGVNIKKFKYSKDSEDFLFWFNRISPEKGAEIAIEVAQESRQKLIIAGPIQNRDYFNNIIKSKIDDGIKFLGPLNFEAKNKYYQKAKVLLMPIKWEEPFGLVMVEAMACGTPVIAFNRGSVAEIVKDGETGFVCPAGDIKAMIKAVRRIYEMPEDEYQKMRENCRKHVEENFTLEKMVENYEKVYEKVIGDWKQKHK